MGGWHRVPDGGLGKWPHSKKQRNTALSYHCLILHLLDKATVGTESVFIGIPKGGGHGTTSACYTVYCFHMFPCIYTLLYHHHSYLHGHSALNTQLHDSSFNYFSSIKQTNDADPCARSD